MDFDVGEALLAQMLLRRLDSGDRGLGGGDGEVGVGVGEGGGEGVRDEGGDEG